MSSRVGRKKQPIDRSFENPDEPTLWAQLPHRILVFYGFAEPHRIEENAW